MSLMQEEIEKLEQDFPAVKEAARLAYKLMGEIPRGKQGEPLTLEGAIKSFILKNPETFQYRDEALGGLYCILGSGIDWNKEGRLADSCPNNYMNMPPEAGGQGCWSDDFGMSDSLKQMGLFNSDIENTLREDHKQRQLVAIKTVHYIDKRCQEYSDKRQKRFYPFSWYACNLCAPKNVQEDFFHGAIETAKLVLNQKFDIGTQEWICMQRTQRYAKEILMALEARLK